MPDKFMPGSEMEPGQVSLTCLGYGAIFQASFNGPAVQAFLRQNRQKHQNSPPARSSYLDRVFLFLGCGFAWAAPARLLRCLGLSLLLLTRLPVLVDPCPHVVWVPKQSAAAWQPDRLRQCLGRPASLR